MLVIALLIAVAIPILSLVVIHSLDKFKTGQFWWVILSFGAGIVAYGIAALVNPVPLHLGWINYDQMVRFLAPAVEEILKALILLILIRRPQFNYFVDGAIYGFATGIGFAVVENFEYISGHVGTAIIIAITRVISTNLMHAAACALVGIVLGWARFQKPFPKWTASFGGLLLAILLHTGYNNLVTRVTSGWLLLYAVIMGGGAAGFIAFMIRRGLKEEQGWIKETLGATDRVESQEVAAVQNISKADAVLKRLAAQFGIETAKKIEALLYIQANLGIKRMSAEKMSDEKLRIGILAEIEKLRKEMETIRRSIGSYAMLYLRYTHLEEMFSVYDILGARIQQLAAQPRGPGMGVFDRLKGVVVTSTSDDKKSEES